MAVYNTVTLNANDWFDVNTLSGAAVGAAIRIQNISTGSCYLVESTTKPVRTDGIVLFSPEFGDLSISDIDAGALKIWAKPVDEDKRITLIISD